jgi:hypothetical protein
MIAAAVLAIAASAPVLSATTTPASADEWRDRGAGSDDVRDLLRDRVRTRADLRDLISDLLRDRQDMRGNLRERIRSWRGEDEDEDEGGGGSRGRLRERLTERMAERNRDEDSSCYFLTRSLRDEDGDFIIIIRRRICRD